MKTSACPRASRILRAAVAATLVLAACGSFTFAQSVVDPDPDIFDGTKTKRDAINQTPQTAVDDWEGGNMVVYDTNGQDAQQGTGQGGSGNDGAGNGMEIGVSMGGLPGIPIPLGGGGGIPSGESGLPSLQLPGAQPPGSIPMGGGPAMPPGGMPPGGMSAGGAQSSDISGAAQSSARPSSVSIGDPSQRIKTNAQGQAGNTAGTPEGGEPGGKEAGEDSTQMPGNIGAGAGQTGTRGGGVEKGDAMPPDQI